MTLQQTALLLSSLFFLFSTIAAAYRVYKSKGEAESEQRRGKSESKKIARRHHERVVRVCN